MCGGIWFKTKKTKCHGQFRLFKMKNKGLLSRFSNLIRFYTQPSFVVPG